MTALIDIDVASSLWGQAETAKDSIRRAADVCDAFFHGALNGKELSVLLCDDAAIRQLNKQWRKIDKATNVLSFPVGKSNGSDVLLGDIAIAFETVDAESKADAKPFADHFSHLIVHGILHLLGFDHEIDADAEDMEEKERLILAELGIANPHSSSLEA